MTTTTTTSSSVSHRPPSTLLIPHKRALLPPSANKSASPKCINPSATPPAIQMRKPAFSSLPSETADEERTSQRDSTGVPVIEFDFSQAPQPFLDAELWARIRTREAAAAAQERGGGGGGGGGGSDHQLDDEQRRRQREREAEYGRMAVRQRSAVRGRGHRPAPVRRMRG